MTDLNASVSPEAIVKEVDSGHPRLHDPGDRSMADGEGRSLARERGLRSAVKADIDEGRDWARERAAMARGRIEEAPLKTSFYALGIGVLIGMLLRR